MTVSGSTLMTSGSSAAIAGPLVNVFAGDINDRGGVQVTAKADADGTILIVEDDGPGIPLSDREFIFEPFRQGSSAPTHAPGIGTTR